jgi:shikimate dehydrogenase
MINGHTELIAHLGYPTETFTAPMIYNPWLASRGINAVVIPMGTRAEDYEAFLRPLFRLSNIRGALVTMPHKVATVDLLDEAALAVQVAGSSFAVRTARSMAICLTALALYAGQSERASTLLARIV